MKLDDVLGEVAQEHKALTQPQKVKLLALVEKELDAFDAWFAAPLSEGGGGNSPMARPERAMVKTYLVARLTARFPSVLEAETKAS